MGLTPLRGSALRGSRPAWPGALVVVAAAIAGLVAVTVTGLIAGPGPRTPLTSAAVPVTGACFGVTGLFLLRHRPQAHLARLVSWVGLTALAWSAAWAWSGSDWAAWVTQWAWFPTLPLATVVVAVFPARGSSVRQARRSRSVTMALAAGAFATAALAVAAWGAPRTLLTDPSTPLSRTGRVAVVAAAVAVALWFLATLAVLRTVWLRARAATGRQRSRYACLAPAAVLLPGGVVLDILQVPYALVPGSMALPAGIAVAILGFEYDDLDLAIDRRVIAVTASSVVVVFAAFALLLLAPVLRGAPWPVVAGGVALCLGLLTPLHRAVTGRVSRWLYGRRHDPAGVLRGVGEHLSGAPSTDEAMSRIVAHVADTLRLPYVGLVATVQGREIVVAEQGRKVLVVNEFGAPRPDAANVRLLATARSSAEHLTAEERWVLTEVARQAGLLASTQALVVDLRRAREQIVRAREDERVRVRYDLHDGLGPVLAGVAMQLRAASADPDPGTSRELVVAAEAHLAEAGRTLRAVVDGLRPVELDAGLVAAVTALARALLPQKEIRVLTEPEQGLGVLPPAVEVAAYRIIGEAMSNIARHAPASNTCTVSLVVDAASLVVDAALRVTVRDDGTGPAASSRFVEPGHGGGGVGTTSMAARAEELGGWLRVTSDATGTCVEAHLPVEPT